MDAQTHRITKRRRQLRTACDTCRRRKTKCNVSDAVPCSVCTKSQIPCRITPDENAPQTAAGSASSWEETPLESPNSCPSTILQASAVMSHNSLDNGLPGDTDREKAADDLSRNGLRHFYQHGLDSNYWTVFADSEHIRLAYVGTATSNITHLINLKGRVNPTLHFPYPPIRPPLPWKPDSLWGHMDGNHKIAQDLACFPSKDIRDALVDAFFEKIYPGFPILDEITFRQQYRNKSNPPPLLLFQAILLVGAHVCDHPTVEVSRMIVKRTLYRRASMLFHMRHENNRLNMVQAALLFTWHLENSDSVCDGSYYWLGIAQRMAYGMGMHRDLSQRASSRLPLWERRVNRRIWWTIVQAEIFSCLEYGRPCMINWSDTDQPALEPEDFAEGETGEVSGSIKVDYIMHNVSIALVGHRILHLNPRSTAVEETVSVPAIQASLAHIAVSLPPLSDFWSCQLRIHFNLILLYLHRNGVFFQAVIPQKNRSDEICSDASQSILTCFETMIQKGWTGQCCFTAVSAAMAAAIQMTSDARAAMSSEASLLAVNIQDRLCRLLRCTDELERFWPSAGAVHGLLDELFQEFKTSTRRDLVNLPVVTAEDDRQHNTLGASVVWPSDGLMDSFCFDVEADIIPFEWMNDAGFLDSSLG